MEIFKKNKAKDTTQAIGAVAKGKAATGKAAGGKAADANEYYDSDDIMIKADKDNVGFASNYSIYRNNIYYSYADIKRGKKLSNEIRSYNYQCCYSLCWESGEFIKHGWYKDNSVYILSDKPYDHSFNDNDPQIFGLLPAHFFTPENRLALENLAKKNIEYCGIKYKDTDEQLKARYEELRKIYKQKCAEYNELPQVRKAKAENERLSEEAKAAQEQKAKSDVENRQIEIRGIIGKWDDEMQRTE